MNRRALAIGAGAAVVVLVLWYLAFWKPRDRALDQAGERRQAAEQQESQLRSEIARLRGAQAQEPARRARLEALRTAIPDEPNLAQFILDANEAANRAGIDFISIAPSLPAAPAAAPGGATPTTAPAGGGPTATTTTTPPAGAPPAQAARPAEVRLNLQISGGYFQVLDFLNRLDDLPRLVVSDSVNVTADQTARLTVALTGRIFLRAVPPDYARAGAGAGGAAGGGATPTPAPPTTAPAPGAPAGR